jgi:hypothetical protein
MRFHENTAHEALRHIFSVELDSTDLAAAVASERQFHGFIGKVFDRLANMIAAYLFKHAKEQWIAYLNSDDIKDRVAALLAERIALVYRE